MPQRALKAFRLTPAAQTDLASVWTYTAQTWSVDQADTYLAGIRKTLDVLLASPEIARNRTEIAPPVRIHRHRSHIIVYRIEAPYLTVIRIRHGHEDWIGDPAGGE